MALIGNRSVLHKSPGRFLSGTVASIERSNFSKAGQIANRFQSLSMVFGGLPNGHLSPSSWSLPRTAGAMSSNNSAVMALAATGHAVGGVTASGSASMTFTVPDATGSLIASGAGAASFAITAGGTMTGNINGSGSAAFAITTNTPVLGALASGSGNAVMTFSATGNILPLDDTPPARTGSASFAITASAIPSAIGHMSGSTEIGGELTEAGIAAATVAALQATTIPVDVQKVRGQDLEGTGIEADPWGPA